MNNSPKEKNDKPSSNFQEPIIDKGDKAVKKPEDKDYTQDDPNFKDPAKQREREEQPVDPIKKAPTKDQ